MPARRQEAGETDAGSAHVISRPWVGPGGPKQAKEAVRPARGNLNGTAQLPPSVLDERQVINTVVLNRLPEAIEPLVARLSICRRLNRDRQQFLLRPVHRAAESSRRSVDILEGRPDPLHQGHDTIAGNHRLCSGDAFDLRDGLLQALASEMGTPPSECPVTKPAFEFPRVCGGHRHKTFWHNARARQ